MTDAELLQKVKDGLGIVGTYQDATLGVYIDDAKAYMLDAGVPAAVLQSDKAAGAIMRYVADNWNLSSGTVKVSEIFTQRLIQLSAADAHEKEGEL